VSPDHRARRLIAGLLLSTHPGPTVAVTLVAVIVGVGVGLEGWRLVLLGLVIALNQASVGLSNDWIDADRDRSVGRTDKPVARGQVPVATARAVAVGCAVASMALTVPLGWGATVAHAVFLGSAWAYNAGLKSTVVSLVPYLVSFGLLPAIVTLSLPEPRVAATWAIALGALLGAAAHFANVLPDLVDDDATGVRGLPHRLGARASGFATFAVLAAAGIVGFVGPDRFEPIGLVGLIVSAAIAVIGTTLVLTRPPSRLLFRLIIVAAIVDVVVLATSGTALLS
jgi:4-hydroxybenzoate polyprenyltransferase